MSGPIWRNNLRDALLLEPLVIAHGNVKDVFSVTPEQVRTLPESVRALPYLQFDLWLALEFERLGYSVVLLYDPVDGIVALRGPMATQFQKLAASTPGANATGVAISESSNAPSHPGLALPKGTTQNTSAPQAWLQPLTVRQTPQEFFRTLYQNVLHRSGTSVAVVCRFTDRYLAYTDRQGTEERELSLLIQKAAMVIPQRTKDGTLASRIALIFNSAGEVPLELNTQSPFARSVLIPSPTVEEREEFFAACHSFFDHGRHGELFEPNDPNQLRTVANLSDGLRMQDLISLAALSRQEQLGLNRNEVKRLLDRFRFGMRENAWLKVKQETLQNANKTLSIRVKGQDEVLEEVVPVLIRAKLGMSDSGDSQFSTKPRGAFFFVGPTGVGKTELSKAIAELIFGDEKALIRFDMSEYSEEHQQARLIGAPPGYVGFDQGGQLTNAIVERPFSVVLFDEIEKAHGRILDKFLQILDDGRLTDGMGRTVYFSEAIIIFTSNLGTSPASGSLMSGIGNSAGVPMIGSPKEVSEVYARLANLPYDELCDHFRREVKEFFVNRLGRPEILNRIGEENILVFKFLTNINTKMAIVDQQIKVLDAMLQEKYQIRLYCTKSFKQLLIEHPNGFARNGARGVRNLLNRLVLNPVAERLFIEPTESKGKMCRVDYLVDFDRIAETPMDRTAIKYEWVIE